MKFSVKDTFIHTAVYQLRYLFLGSSTATFRYREIHTFLRPSQCSKTLGGEEGGE